MPRVHRVYAQIPVDLTDEDVEQVVNGYLENLSEECWIDGQKVMTEQYTSHRYDVCVGKVDEPALAIRVAAIRLKNLLREQRQLKEKQLKEKKKKK